MEALRLLRKQLRNLDWGTVSTLLHMVKAMNADSLANMKQLTSTLSNGYKSFVEWFNLYCEFDCYLWSVFLLKTEQSMCFISPRMLSFFRVLLTVGHQSVLDETQRKKERVTLRTGDLLLTWIHMLSPPWLQKPPFCGSHECSSSNLWNILFDLLALLRIHEFTTELCSAKDALLVVVQLLSCFNLCPCICNSGFIASCCPIGLNNVNI